MKIETTIWIICLLIFIAAKLFAGSDQSWTEIILWFYVGIQSIENKRLLSAARNHQKGCRLIRP
ncbi:MAG: hypothetical protein EOP87_00070 [Verrucomicrobiaceae bacterium]|nr:MAG: hypothetical protein EOP87_00070 [Verrucomicrobiaceae bacterium]